MKHTLLTFFFIFLAAIGLSAREYSIDEIPNVQVMDATKHLSNPDGIISLPAQAQIDSILYNIRQTGSQVAVVVVDDIDTDDIDTFATDLFTKWGIGQKEHDNGLLVLIVKNQRQAVIRTGYGLEGDVPDIVAGKIIRHDMAPYFKNEDYDSGVIAAVKRLQSILTDPVVATQFKQDAKAEQDRERDEMISLFLKILGGYGIAVLAFVLGLIVYVDKKHGNESPNQKYQLTNTAMKTLSILGLFTIAPLLAAGVLALWRKHLRNKPIKCSHCGQDMIKLSEDADNAHLSPAQNLEEKIKSVDYDVWVCPNDHSTKILRYDRPSNFTECPVCHAKTVTLVDSSIVKRPTQYRSGLKQLTYECLNCKNITRKNETIPPQGGVVVVGGGRGGFGGGGSFGGGFGGGMTGGGGARGGW